MKIHYMTKASIMRAVCGQNVATKLVATTYSAQQVTCSRCLKFLRLTGTKEK